MPSLNENLRGREYWRSLEHLANSPRIQAALEAEFAGYDPQDIRSLSRRGFMKIMAASMALAGITLSGCRRWPEGSVRPFAAQPENMHPGGSLYYATMMEIAGVATGLLARSYDGRPIKIEGNDRHPFSLGAADGWAQASLLEMYDPQRSRGPVERREGRRSHRSWADFDGFAAERFGLLRTAQGRGLAVLCAETSGVTFARLKAEWQRIYPKASWGVYEPVGRENERQGTNLAFGRVLRPQYQVGKAKVIACFDSDLLGLHPAHQKHARDWAAGRRSADEGTMNRLYAVEANYSITGSVADHRLAVRPTRVALLLAALAQTLGIEDAGLPKGVELSGQEKKFIIALAADLVKDKGQSLLVVGWAQPAEAHAWAWVINEWLGNIGQTVTLTADPVGEEMAGEGTIGTLAADMAAGKVDTLVILGGNPVYDGPADAGFGAALARVGAAIHLSAYEDETSALCRWHLPQAHELECWGDGRAWDGTISLQQPLILPLFDGRSALEILAGLAGLAEVAGQELVRQTFVEKGLLKGGDFETAWRRVLEAGVVAESAWPVVKTGEARLPKAVAWGESHRNGFELQFVPDYAMYDGRFANNGWLQEVPDPMSKLTWDNAALVSPADAEALGLVSGDVVRIEIEGERIGEHGDLRSPAKQEDGSTTELPGAGAGAAHSTLRPPENAVWHPSEAQGVLPGAGEIPGVAVFVLPGVARGAIVLPLGYGRRHEHPVGQGVGFDAYPLRRSKAAYIVTGVRIKPTGQKYPLAATQEHHLIDKVGQWGVETRVGMPGASGLLIKEASFAEYQEDRRLFQRDQHGNVHLQLWDPPSQFNDPHAWGMAVDINSCLGCNACVLACQAENNIPIVGKEQVANNREMHWLRIDRYFKGSAEAASPDVVHQPLMCVHCENAPCESVCPVAATEHDSEGLNVMVYNRCIGTRYCSNNCPYKVRRFNYFDYHAKDPRGEAQPWLAIPDQQQQTVIDEIKRMLFNPDVTVRMRGVMEKCTYCVQRIQAAKISAKVEHAGGKRESDLVQEGEVVTACQAACPTEAIVFGNLNDPKSKVARLAQHQRAYGMLGELNTRPRTQHLAKLRNHAFDPYDLKQHEAGAAPGHAAPTEAH
ncbi:MAG: TAT-variant-translocated molybdopterin oxidoreductase [Phycisphaeraceae bacterium]|nr:TAT-variant-translocated molybdopterin oxidoreductase [Phycisphaeraceae bacterium]